MLRVHRFNSIRRKSQSGMTLVELLLAMVILTIGICGLLGLVITSINNNSRAKQDTGGTMVAQLVIETIAAEPSATGTISVTDCAGTVSTINVAGAGAPGAGANLNAAGAVDFTQTYAAAPGNYKMKYATCGAANSRVIYDVRWNIQTLSPYSKQVTVSARPAMAETFGNKAMGARLFQQPVTLKTIAVQGN